MPAPLLPSPENDVIDDDDDDDDDDDAAAGEKAMESVWSLSPSLFSALILPTASDGGVAWCCDEERRIAGTVERDDEAEADNGVIDGDDDGDFFDESDFDDSGALSDSPDGCDEISGEYDMDPGFGLLACGVAVVCCSKRWKSLAWDSLSSASVGRRTSSILAAQVDL